MESTKLKHYINKFIIITTPIWMRWVKITRLWNKL